MKALFLLHIVHDTKDIHYWYSVFVQSSYKQSTIPKTFMNDVVPLYNPVLNNREIQEWAVYTHYFASAM